MNTDTDIILSGPFKVKDGAGLEQEVKAIRIFDETYGVIDVYIDFVKPQEKGAFRDRVLITAILARLHTLGYQGPDFFDADPAVQERRLIVLEAAEEFCEFAKRHGWKNLAEEFDE